MREYREDRGTKTFTRTELDFECGHRIVGTEGV